MPALIWALCGLATSASIVIYDYLQGNDITIKDTLVLALIIILGPVALLLGAILGITYWIDNGPNWVVLKGRKQESKHDKV